MVLIVAQAENPQEMEAFLLDKAVSVNEGVWHQVMAISDTARVKVTENIDMPSNESETWNLPNNLVAKIIF
jgi:ureidoglycolate hydrolase